MFHLVDVLRLLTCLSGTIGMQSIANGLKVIMIANNKLELRFKQQITVIDCKLCIITLCETCHLVFRSCLLHLRFFQAVNMLGLALNLANRV